MAQSGGKQLRRHVRSCWRKLTLGRSEAFRVLTRLGHERASFAAVHGHDLLIAAERGAMLIIALPLPGWVGRENGTRRNPSWMPSILMDTLAHMRASMGCKVIYGA